MAAAPASPAPPAPSLAGQVIVVTGATSGIGEETALGIARRGATVVVVGRDPLRTENTVARIRTAVPGADIDGRIANLALLAEVRRLAVELSARYEKIAGLVNNAGAVYTRREITPEGHERTWALNVLAPYLLTNLLAEPLRRGAPARVIMVSSAAHQWQHLDFQDLEAAASHYSGFRHYGRSKLAVLLLTHEFALRWARSGVTVNAVHPGYVATGFGKNTPGTFNWVVRFSDFFFAIPPNRGALTPVYVATSPEVAGVNGEYFVRCRAVPSSAASYDLTAARRLWSICAAQTGVGG